MAMVELTGTNFQGDGFQVLVVPSEVALVASSGQDQSGRHVSNLILKSGKEVFIRGTPGEILAKLHAPRTVGPKMTEGEMERLREEFVWSFR